MTQVAAYTCPDRPSHHIETMEGDVGIKKEGESTEEKVKEINCSWKADRIGEV